MAPEAQTTLAIIHTKGSNPPAFTLTRLADGEALDPVSIPSPYEFPVEGSPQFRLMRQLRWYLEHFLDYPYHPDTIAAEHVLDALKAWGSQAFNAIFPREFEREWLAQADIIQIRSEDPAVLSWPWEALFDPNTGSYIVHQRPMERQINKRFDLKPTGDLPTDRINILLVVARPYENDISYRSIARPLVDLIRTQNLPAHVDVLRPPTFDQLRTHLEEHPNYYHLLHFDGHGIYNSSRREGYLAFENNRGAEDLKSAADINTLLRKYSVPAVVLNACQSAALDDKSEDPFATVATALLQSGIRSVVAMAYSLTVRGAQSFLPSFYGHLFQTGSIAEGVRAGRKQMLSDKRRISPRGPYELEDWLLPVLYQQQTVDYIFATQSLTQSETKPSESRLPQEVVDYREDNKFVGRDGAILRLERVLHLDRPAIVVQGLGGAGKTRLAREFLRWLDETGGLDAALWFDFRDIRNAEYVFNRIGELFYGENFGIALNKLDLLAKTFRQHRVIIVWDNFESADKNLTSEDRAQLGQLLNTIRSTRGKVIITSRSTEEWLPLPPSSRLSLAGLQGEERWEYCESVLTGLGLKVNRNDSQLTTLMDQLMGHPLAMRVVLPLLERTSAEKIITALRSNIADLGLSAEGEEGRIFATLHFVEQGLPDDLRPLMPLVGLHESYLDTDALEIMARQVNPSWTRPTINRLMKLLASAGLLREIGNETYELHPLLSSHLRTGNSCDEVCLRAFADTMCQGVNDLARTSLLSQRAILFLHGANLHNASQIANDLAMDEAFVRLSGTLAQLALSSHDFIESSRRYQEMAHHSAKWGHPEFEVVAHHQLGLISQEQGDLKTAQDRYLKSLALTREMGDPTLITGALQQLGVVARLRHDYAVARDWFLKSLDISEGQESLFERTAAASHELGTIALELRDFESAREWYLKSLAICQEHSLQSGNPLVFFQLGRVAQDEGDLESARGWYLKSCAILEQVGDLHEASLTYAALGTVSLRQGDFQKAREWYLKALAVNEKEGDHLRSARVYHQLGRVGEEQQDFRSAREWYFKALVIEKKGENQHDCALSLGSLGRIEGQEGAMSDCASYLTQSISIFQQTNDPHTAKRMTNNFFVFYKKASTEDQQIMESIWHEAGLGSFPDQPVS